jgi:hypothetical protein
LKTIPVIAVAAALSLGLSSCNGPEEQRPLTPRSMFSTGARFLDDARTLAIRGSIEFRAGDTFESGSFSLFVSGPDSLSFLIEGPFKVDLFRIVVLPEMAFLESRNDAESVILEPGEKFRVPEYGIERLSPSLLGVYIFPQYYLSLADASGPSTRLISRSDASQYTASSAGDGRQVTLMSPESDLLADYTKASNLPGGFYPADIEIFDRSEKWRMTLEIEKVKKNVRLPVKAWSHD